jgi:tetratricopeptide (TPR) repeat protein
MSRPFSGSPTLARRCAWALVVCSALCGLGWLSWSCRLKPEVYFLPRLAPADWILYPSGPRVGVNARVEMSTLFRRSFTLERPPRRALLSIAALRSYALSINGEPATPPVRPGTDWKHPNQFDVSRHLRAGENQIAVTVSNSNGPPVLWLSLDADGLRVNSDEKWEASYGGAAWRQARLATKPKIALLGSPISGGEDPWPSLRTRWWVLLLFAALSAAAYWLMHGPGPATDHATRNTQPAVVPPLPAIKSLRSQEFLPLLALAVVWLALFANNLGVVPNLVGFDVDGHLAYICYIQEHHSLPRADQGWEMFQPPLYYVMGASMLGLLSLSATHDSGVMGLRLMGMVIGMAHFVLVWTSLRLLFPQERSKQTWGLLLAAALPPVLYLSQYVSNEGLAAALVTACLFLTLRMLNQERISWKACLGLGLCLGAALLTKATAFLTVPPIAGALLWNQWLARRDGTPHSALRIPHLAVALVACFVVSGWHYGRLWAQCGSPFIGVWDPRLGFSWWQDDGYRTSAFYLRFGSVLAHAWFGSFQSFGDGIYSTLWGDGLLGGKANLIARPPWNYDLMAVGYWLALVPTLAVVVGAVLAILKFLQQPSAQWFLLLGLAFLSVLALLHLSLVLPYQCHVKAFYVLCALLPLCAFGAVGFDALCHRGPGLRTVIGIAFGVWVINSCAALWVSRSSEATVLSRTDSLLSQKRPADALALLRTGLERESNPSPKAQALLAQLLAATGDLAEARKLAEAAVQRGPGERAAHIVLADILARQHQVPEAIQHARQAVQLAPGNDAAYEQLASLLLSDGHADEVVRTAREGLAVAPFSTELHQDLGAALLSRGEPAEGLAQLQLACAIDPNALEPRLLLASTEANQGKLAEAILNLRKALHVDPANAAVHSQLAASLYAQKQTAEAISEYAEANRLKPDNAPSLNNLAWIYAANPNSEFRNGAEAVRLAERACELTRFQEPVIVGTLAAAYAEAGRFDDAATTARKARQLALAAGQQELAGKNQKLVEFFTARQPYRDK